MKTNRNTTIEVNVLGADGTKKKGTACSWSFSHGLVESVTVKQEFEWSHCARFVCFVLLSLCPRSCLQELV